MNKKVGIIGGAGFIGSQITNVFLDNNFEVKVGTTNISMVEKYQHLMNLNSSHNLHISELDVTDKEVLRTFVSDCDIVIHSGTPFILDVEDPQTQLFDPTIKGTENFLEIIHATPGIGKVVFVASVASYNTNFPMPAGGRDFYESFDENSEKFTSIESHPYAQAKFIANQVVEKFIAENKDLNYEISSVSPVMVMGKSLSGREDSTSGGLQYLIKNMIAPDAFIQSLYDNDVPFSIVDVRDVAQAIFNSAITKGLHGKNHLLASEIYRVSDIHSMMNGRNAAHGPTKVYNSDLARRDLNMNFRPVIETLRYCCE